MNGKKRGCLMSEQNNFIEGDDKSKKKRKEKTLKQKIASAQMRLNILKSKNRLLSKQAETRQKIILGAEIAKVLNCDIYSVDKELLLGLLLDVPLLHPDDVKSYRRKRFLYLETMKGRQI